MRIIACEQGSEEWDNQRKGRATASRFSEIVTPSKLKFSTQSRGYAIELASQILGIETPPRLPTFDMEIGTEREPIAREEYAELNEVTVDEVGFCLPDDSDRWGCSPDGLIESDGLLEIKCPRAETIMDWYLRGVMPPEYMSQVQGQMWVTGRKWCDFFAWHPEIEPFQIRVEADEAYHDALAEALPKFTEVVDSLLERFRPIRRELLGINFDGVSSDE